MRNREVTTPWKDWCELLHDERRTVAAMRQERIDSLPGWIDRCRRGTSSTARHHGRREVTQGLCAIIRWLGDCTTPTTTTAQDYVKRYPPTYR
jgi:hypothetical protein